MILEIEEADLIKNKIIHDFSEITIIGVGIGNYISIVLKMHNLLHYALKFIDNLDYIDFNVLNKDFRKGYHNILDNVIQMALLIKETIKYIQENPSGIILKINNIHQVSENIELLIRATLSTIFKDKDLEIRSLVFILSSIKIIESIIDKINHISDNIRVLYYESQFWSRKES